MKPTATDMLKRLDPAVRPMSNEAASPRTGAMEHLSFSSLIQHAVTRPTSTGARVSAAEDINLDDIDHDRIAVAADEAAAAGSKRALILIDDRAFVLDVSRRHIDDELQGADLTARISTGIDTAILARPAEPAPTSELSILTRLAGRPWPASVMDLMQHQPDAAPNETTPRDEPRQSNRDQ